MIKFLYKIIHYEASFDHKTNVRRSYFLIIGIIITLPVSLLYLLYNGMSKKDLLTDIVFLGILAATARIIYFLVRKDFRSFLIKSKGFDYYDFGRYNTMFKTLLFLFIIGLIILIGRLFASWLHV